jgi:antitoxin VapB
MAMNTAKIFLNGRSQAVRLPKDCRFEDEEVFIARVDDMVILYPKRKGWDVMERGIRRFTGDFMAERDQPIVDDRRSDL